MMAEKENKACGRVSTFSSLGLDVMMEFYATNGFPTKDQRKIISDFIGETEKRVQQWFKRRRRADQKRNQKVMRGDPSELLSELKIKSTFQLRPTSRKREWNLVEEKPSQESAKENGILREDNSGTTRVIKEEPRMTPYVWPHPRTLPLVFGASSMEGDPFAFPALKSVIRTTPTKTPSKEAKKSQFAPALLESSNGKSNIRIKHPFEEDPTPTKKRRKLSSDAMRFIPTADAVMEGILTSHLLPPFNTFLWDMDGFRSINVM